MDSLAFMELFLSLLTQFNSLSENVMSVTVLRYYFLRWNCIYLDFIIDWLFEKYDEKLSEV